MATDGRIGFATKAESNARRERAFLALAPAERFLWFLRSFGKRHDPNAPDTYREERPTRNFMIRKKA